MINIQPLSDDLDDSIKRNIDSKTKPIKSLGKLENIAFQIAKIQNTLNPFIASPTLIIFAGDHGIAVEGVSPYPQEVTWQMVQNFISGGAAINVFCRQLNWQLQIVDTGVNHDFNENEIPSAFKIGYGTKNFLKEKALSDVELHKALSNGFKIIENLQNVNLIAFGEMGIGNTSSASLIMHKITQIPLEDCVGRGTGLNDAGYQHKLKILQNASENHQCQNPLDVLQTFGGFEIATMVGAILKAAELKFCIVVDGFIVTSAILIAHKLNSNVLNYCLFAHQSDEKGHKLMLEYLKVEPILQLNMRLGEGTGAALSLPIIQAAANFLNEMTSFNEAGVSNK